MSILIQFGTKIADSAALIKLAAKIEEEKRILSLIGGQNAELCKFTLSVMQKAAGIARLNRAVASLIKKGKPVPKHLTDARDIKLMTAAGRIGTNNGPNDVYNAYNKYLSNQNISPFDAVQRIQRLAENAGKFPKSPQDAAGNQLPIDIPISRILKLPSIFIKSELKNIGKDFAAIRESLPTPIVDTHPEELLRELKRQKYLTKNMQISKPLFRNIEGEYADVNAYYSRSNKKIILPQSILRFKPEWYQRQSPIHETGHAADSIVNGIDTQHANYKRTSGDKLLHSHNNKRYKRLIEIKDKDSEGFADIFTLQQMRKLYGNKYYDDVLRKINEYGLKKNNVHMLPRTPFYEGSSLIDNVLKQLQELGVDYRNLYAKKQ
ncbi:hypothetical protein FACS1894214_2690 [Planctomycetales bacterium]|nr:hypothetical protein FACS1894214_2690 [Planctomycetales bacterium]